MKIISFIVVLIEITKEENSLKCQYNEEGADPKEKTCAEGEEFCSYTKTSIGVTRQCIKDDKGLDIKVGCLNWPRYQIATDSDCNDPPCNQFTIANPKTFCYCKQDNCNIACTSGENCTKVLVPKGTAGVQNLLDLEYDKCDSNCTPSGGDQVTDPAAIETNGTTAEDKNEDSKATEKLDASTTEDKGEDSQATEGATENGKGEDSKATERSGGATTEPESGTGATKKSGCQRITNSFKNFFLFWMLACIVIT